MNDFMATVAFTMTQHNVIVFKNNFWQIDEVKQTNTQLKHVHGSLLKSWSFLMKLSNIDSSEMDLMICVMNRVLRVSDCLCHFLVD